MAMVPLRVLQIEDSESDGAMIIRLLQKANDAVHWLRVEDAGQMRVALKQQPWDVVICDFKLPQFDAPSALTVLKETGLDIPFIVVSGTMGEENAVEMMRRGAQDYLMKGQMARLAPSVAREVADARHRQESRQTQEFLHQSEERYHLLFNSGHDAVFVHEGANASGFPGRFLEVNDIACQRLGYTREELLQMSPAGIFAAEIQPTLPALMKNLQVQTYLTLESVHVAKDGRRIPVEISNHLFNLDGKPAVLSVARDITERKKDDELLRASLDEKIVLLKEVHHRVKNNLQIVASLLNLQSERINNPVIQETLLNTRNRVHSMALLHETLYHSDNLACLDIADFVEQLTSHLLSSFGAVARQIRIDCNIVDVRLGMDQAVPCGLIINELVSNAIKYAFPNERPGRITVEMHPEADGQVFLSVSDDGIGLPGSLDVAKTESLGLKLVSTLTSQLRGVLEVKPRMAPDSGALFQISFPSKPD
jgi:PAS domain S-box-containing protein